MENNKYKVLSIILGAVVLALGFVVIYRKQIVLSAPQIKQNESAAPQITNSGEKAIANFPAEFVTPNGASNVNNYAATFPGKQTDLNQQFTTDQSAASIASYYMKIFEDNGWQSRILVDDEKNKSLNATKGDVSAGLFISTDSEGQTFVRVIVSK